MARYLVTGGAGFIGSNLTHSLVIRGDDVLVLDDFSSGNLINLQGVLDEIHLVEGSICDRHLLNRLTQGIDVCFHLAAITSVPRSVDDPWPTNRVNVEGSLNVFLACRAAGVKRIVYASSSSVYGDSAPIPTPESSPLAPISPYGITKAAVDHYARVLTRLYQMEIVGLRYFNVFGPRQNLKSQYAAVIPLFISKMLSGEQPVIYGDGLQSRDFTFVDNVVDANLRAADVRGTVSGVYNIACGESTSVRDLAGLISSLLGAGIEPKFLPPRPGDIARSLADLTAAKRAFGYVPLVAVEEGLRRTIEWYKRRVDASSHLSI
ncbi:MAG: epimerase [Candidatus Hydrogenedentota bacterium]